MKFAEDIDKLKEYSIEQAHKDYGKKLFSELEQRSKKIQVKISNILFESHRPNEGKIQEDERLAAQQALKRIQFSGELDRLFAYYAKNLWTIRERYYRALMRDFAKAFNRSTPVFIGLKVAFTKKEISTLKKTTFGKPVSRSILVRKEKFTDTVNNTILESYQKATILRRLFKPVYLSRLKGNFRQLNRFFQGLTRDLMSETYEQAYQRFMAVLNG